MRPAVADIAGVMSAVGSIGQLIVLMFATFIAYRQLNLWQDQRKRTRMAEVAEQVYVAAHMASEALKYMRAAFRSYGQREGESKEQAEWRDLAERWNATNQPFADLKAAQLRAAIILGNEKIQTAVERLFDVRFEAQFAQEELFRSKTETYSDEDRRRELNKFRSEAYGTYGSHDPLGLSQITALETLESETAGYIRLEEKIRP